MDKFLQMVVNTVMRRVVNLVVDKGIKHFSSKAKPASDLTSADQAQAISGNDLAQRARDIAKLTRKIR